MYPTQTITLALIGLLAVNESVGPAQEAALTLNQAWASWKNGDILEAEDLAKKASPSADASALLCLCAFVKGDYEQALAHYAKIDEGHEKRKMLDQAAT